MPTSPGQLVTHLARERERAYRAEHKTRRRIISAVVAVGLAVVVIGVVAGLATRQPAPGPAPAKPAASPAPEAPTTNARGNIPKQLGELAGFGSSEAPDQNTFAITEITVDPLCTPDGEKPASDHTILLEMTVTTGPDADRAAELGRILTPGFFTVIAPDGTEHDAWPGECTDPGRGLPEPFEANKQYSGTVELRVPEATGALVLAGHMDNATGWEWELEP